MDLAAVLRSVRPGWLALALCCIPAFELLDARIFHLMGRGAGCAVTYRGCLEAVVIGEFYYRLGPAGAPVQLGLMVSAGFDGARAATVYTWKAVANTVVYTLYAVTALLANALVFRADLGRWTVLAVGVLVAAYVLICAAVFALAARPEPVKRLARRVLGFLARHIPALGRDGRDARLMDQLEEFCASMKSLRGDRRLLARALGLMALEMTCLFLIPAFLYRGLGLAGASMARLLLTQVLVMVLSRVVALPGNAGGAEGSFYLFMAPLFGASLAVAMVLWRLCAFVEVMLLGAAASVLRALGRKKRVGR